MSKPITPAATVHVTVPPSGTQDYHAVVHADSGHEIVRCANAAEAVTQQARLNKL